MEKNRLSQTLRGLFVPVLAVLLLATPPARANPEAAISALRKAVRRRGTVSSYFQLGWAHYQRGFKLGSVETANRDDAQSAIDAYAMALNLDPKLAQLPDRSRLYFSMALCYEAVESYEHALDAYNMALTAAPHKALIALHAARLRLKMKNPAKAMANIEMALKKAASSGKEKTLRDAARRDPSFAPLIAYHATRKALGIGDAEELRDAVRDDAPRAAVPARNPMHADGYYQIALAYAVSGKTASALHAVQEAFSSAANTAELRRLVLLAKTDEELSAVRDLPGFRVLVADVSDRVALR